jgi:hypothetical protein
MTHFGDFTQADISEVSPAPSVAVALICCWLTFATVNENALSPLVVMVVDPR